MELIRGTAYDSPARVEEPTRPPLRVGLVQHRWRADAAELRDVLSSGIARAAEAGAEVVFLPELTLSRYPAFEAPAGKPEETAEDLENGPTVAFAAEAAKRHGIVVQASLYEKTDLGDNRIALGARARAVLRDRGAPCEELAQARRGPAALGDATGGERDLPRTRHRRERRRTVRRGRRARRRDRRRRLQPRDLDQRPDGARRNRRDSRGVPEFK